MKAIFFCSLLSCASFLSIASASTIETDLPYLNQLYQTLHQHPEVSFEEKETSKRLVNELRQIGFEVTEQVGGHGFVGVFKNGQGPTVMLRTDMDALPVLEKTGLPYASRAKYTDQAGNTLHVMHACGHDIHMTTFVGAARYLHKHRSAWQGTLIMIGQPAEERGQGAKAMLADGLFERFPRPDYNLALHTSASLPAGKIAYAPEWALANVDSVDITVKGIAGHGAYPHTTKDPVVLASQIVLALQTLVSREVSPLDPAVITIGSIHGGTKHNVISDKVQLQLTVRSYTDAVRKRLLSGIERIAKGQAIAFGIPEDKLPTVIVGNESIPSVYNHPTMAKDIATHLGKYLDHQNIHETPPVMGGEDFALYGRATPNIPSVLFWLGAVNPEKFEQAQAKKAQLPSLHSPYFAPDYQPTIKTGTTALVQAALYLFRNKPKYPDDFHVKFAQK
ncbi:amidohydrolase [Algicola sagamiensis]|uniref:amidohydrolase n=1 Tax=Algicola sagamiensis TaxID=163869 RepID=UPI00037047DB|nr:amidohydrolase [Algicola sagamiensis]